MFSNALIFATKSHDGQYRRETKIPYIVHPIRVSNLVYDTYKNNPDITIQMLDEFMSASLLHDVVEDCNVSLEMIKTNFNSHVASLVEELTSDKEEINKTGKTQYLQNKMSKMSLDALTIKLCDRLDNISDKPDNKYIESTREILNYVLKNRNDMKNHHYILISKIFSVLK